MVLVDYIGIFLHDEIYMAIDCIYVNTFVYQD